MDLIKEPFKIDLEKASFRKFGDIYEQKFGNLITIKFPNIEIFWKLFIIPSTERLEKSPNRNSIGFRKTLDQRLIDMACTHYSIFINLLYAHKNLKEKRLGYIENFYTNLSTLFDLTDTFLDEIFVLLAYCKDYEINSYKYLDKQDFLEKSEDWYNNNYKKHYDYYSSKGKNRPIFLPSRNPTIVKEFLVVFLNKSEFWVNYDRLSKTIKAFRNVIVHDIVVGKIRTSKGILLIPKPSSINYYRTWIKVEEALEDPDKIITDFVNPEIQLPYDLDQVEAFLNIVWGALIKSLTIEFFSDFNTKLRDLYDINFINGETSIPKLARKTEFTYLANINNFGTSPCAVSYPSSNSGSANFRTK
jgi:hypothetical protein